MPSGKPGAAQSFYGAQAGSVGVSVAILAVVSFGLVALALDVGTFYYAKRRLQTAADMAALAAASDLDHARVVAVANMVANGFPAGALGSIDPGSYTADPSLTAAARFVAGPGGNAVRVSTTTTAPLFFGRVLGGPASGIAIGARAVGVRGDTVAFSLGSRAAALNGGLANAVLGALLGTNVSLSVADYQALASARIDLFKFSDSMAARIGLGANATYGDLASRSVSAADAVASLSAAASAGGTSAAALAALRGVGSALGTSSSGTFGFGRLIAFGPAATRVVGTAAPFSTTVGLLDLLYGAAEARAAGRTVSASVAPAIPGVAAVSIDLVVGAPPAGSGFVSVGGVGATLHTAQVRLLVTSKLTALPPLLAVNLPIYLEVAQATGQIDSISCPRADPAQASTTLDVLPGLVDAWIGTVPATDFASLGVAPHPGAAPLATVAGIATISGRAHAAITNLHSTVLTFDQGDVAAARIKTVATTDILSSLASSLVSSLQLNVGAFGLGVPIPSGLDHAVGGTVANALPAIDQVLASVLASLGVSVGDADVRVYGIRCGQGFLVN